MQAKESKIFFGIKYFVLLNLMIQKLVIQFYFKYTTLVTFEEFWSNNLYEECFILFHLIFILFAEIFILFLSYLNTDNRLA